MGIRCVSIQKNLPRIQSSIGDGLVVDCGNVKQQLKIFGGPAPCRAMSGLKALRSAPVQSVFKAGHACRSWTAAWQRFVCGNFWLKCTKQVGRKRTNEEHVPYVVTPSDRNLTKCLGIIKGLAKLIWERGTQRPMMWHDERQQASILELLSIWGARRMCISIEFWFFPNFKHWPSPMRPCPMRQFLRLLIPGWKLKSNLRVCNHLQPTHQSCQGNQAHSSSHSPIPGSAQIQVWASRSLELLSWQREWIRFCPTAFN